MKKLAVMMALMAAIAVAPVFAIDDSAVTLDGDFTYEVGTDFSTTDDAVSQDMDITLGASIGEFTSFSVEIEADPDDSGAFTWDDLNEDEEVDSDEVVYSTGYLVLDSIEMTQEFETFTLTAGAFDFQGTYYDYIYEWEWDSSASYAALQLDYAVTEEITFSAYLPLSEIADELDAIAFEAAYASDMANVAAHYLRDGDEEDGVFGGAAEVFPTEDATVYGQYLYDIDAEESLYMAGASYVIDALTLAAEYHDSIEEFIAVGVSYALNETFTVSAGAYFPTEETADTYGVDAGVAFDVDTVTYTFGASYVADDSTLGETYVAPQSAAGYEENIAVSFSMDIDF
ncbi:MAG: hypothetical protein PQJ59_12130 [Spirochaetales bacterium]|nr:hypothetical protein [Spirochaetales bacterium]